MGVFDAEHQRTIDQISHDGWRYVAQRANHIAENFSGKSAVISDVIYLEAGGVQALIEQGEPNLEWSLPGEWDRPIQDRRVFSQGFRLSVDATAESRSHVVICKPVDWYMLCIRLQIGLNMAALDIATTKNDY